MSRRLLLIRDRADHVEQLGWDSKREGDGLARAAELERLHHRLQFRLGVRPELGEREEAAHDVAQTVGGLVVARLRAERAAQTAVDVTAGREPGSSARRCR